MKSFIYYKAILVVLLISCNRDDEKSDVICNDPSNINCPNYDPCIFSTETSGNFTISTPLSNSLPYADSFIVDTAFIGGSLKFKANDSKADYYKWYLGNEIIEGPNDSVVIRNISAPIDLPLGIYTASLVLTRSPDTICYPWDTGVDSVAIDFRKISFCDQAIINRFKGVYEDATQDSVEIEFIYWNQNRDEYCVNDALLYAINFDGNNDTILLTSDVIGLTNNYLIADGPISGGLNGTFEIDIDQSTINASYSFYKDSIKRKFKGKIF